MDVKHIAKIFDNGDGVSVEMETTGELPHGGFRVSAEVDLTDAQLRNLRDLANKYLID